MTVVLDSWAVLRFLEDAGRAADTVGDLLDQEKPLMSWINLGEVHYVLRRLHGEDAATETVRDLRDVVDARLPDEPFVINAARIKADHPMAYAGAFARPSASPSTPPSGPATPNSSSTDRRGAGGTSGPEGAARSTFTFFALE